MLEPTGYFIPRVSRGSQRGGKEKILPISRLTAKDLNIIGFTQFVFLSGSCQVLFGSRGGMCGICGMCVGCVVSVGPGFQNMEFIIRQPACNCTGYIRYFHFHKVPRPRGKQETEVKRCRQVR